MDKPVRVLMIEDSPLDAELIAARLEASGMAHEMEIVASHETLIAALRERPPDLILSDYMLPGFSGQAALQISQSMRPDVPFVFVSGAIGEEEAIESVKQGATDYVLKDRLERLVPAVTRALSEARQRLERKHAEEELDRRARELTVLNGDLQQFAYAASHDLQEPLRTISLFSKLLITKYSGALDEQADEYLRFIESAAQHMSAMLENMLLYTRIPAQDRSVEDVDLNQIVSETLFLFQVALNESRAEVVYDGLPVVRGNASQLGLVFQNLISNALRYRGPAPPRVEIKAKLKRGTWVISVGDNGMGFEQDYAEQIFGLFKRLHGRETSGTGLGLAICKRIIDTYGGRIWAESQPGQGATFHFSLPAPRAPDRDDNLRRDKESSVEPSAM